MNARSLQSVLVLLAQILGPFGQTWVFHKFGWVFHKFTENGEFYIVRILTIRHKIRDAWIPFCLFWPNIGENIWKFWQISLQKIRWILAAWCCRSCPMPSQSFSPSSSLSVLSPLFQRRFFATFCFLRFSLLRAGCVHRGCQLAVGEQVLCSSCLLLTLQHRGLCWQVPCTLFSLKNQTTLTN